MDVLNGLLVPEPSKLLKNLLNPSANIQNPLYYYLLIHFLKLRLSDFQYLPEELTPEDESYSCLDPMCTYSDTLPVVTRSIGGFSGGGYYWESVVTCECGCSYKTTQRLSNHKEKKIKIINYSNLFYRRFIQLWNDSISIQKISSELKISWYVAKKIAHQLHLPKRGLKFDGFEYQLNERISKCSKPIEAYREEWISTMRNFPDYSYTQLRDINPSLYAWLLRNDRLWLCENRPSTFHNKSENHIPRPDWKRKDLELSEKIQTAANIIRARPGRPDRITITGIEKEIGQIGIIRSRIKNLPLVQEILETLVESRESSAIKRIDWAGEVYKEENIIPTMTKFLKRAGVSNMMGNVIVMEYADSVYKNLLGSRE